jgi:hypothetical protein
MRTYQDAKTMAKSLRSSLAARNVLLSHSKCLEIVAKQLGFTDWNTLSAKLDVDAERVTEPLSCSFCDKSSPEVRRLIEGRCSRGKASACVFICDECVALCAQINADAVGDTNVSLDTMG